MMHACMVTRDRLRAHDAIKAGYRHAYIYISRSVILVTQIKSLVLVSQDGASFCTERRKALKSVTEQHHPTFARTSVHDEAQPKCTHYSSCDCTFPM